MPGIPATTPRLDLPRFGLDDAADFPTQVNALADALDLRVPPLVGTFANRPVTAPGRNGRLYVTTDRGGISYLEKNGVWVPIFLTSFGLDSTGSNRVRAVPNPNQEYELLFDSSLGDNFNQLGGSAHPGLVVVGGRITVANNSAGNEVMGPYLVTVKVGWYVWQGDGIRELIVGPGSSSDLIDSEYMPGWAGVRWQTVSGVQQILPGSPLTIRVKHTLTADLVTEIDWVQASVVKV